MDPTTDPALRSWVPVPPDSHFPIQNLPFGVFYWPGRGVKNGCPEIGVASTKAFTAQLVVLTMVALKVAYAKGSIDQERYMDLLKELHEIPGKAAVILKNTDNIKRIAEKAIRKYLKRKGGQNRSG